jgi:hypothetical protein
MTFGLALGIAPFTAGCSGAPGGEGKTAEAVGQTSEAVTSASAGPATFDADFDNCVEYAGVATVPLANAAPLVPAPFVPASYGAGLTAIVVRVAGCKSVSIEGGAPESGTVLQIGVNINAPNGTGNINNYSLFYLTTSLAVAEGLQRAGVQAEYNPFLLYDAVTNNDGKGHVFLANGFFPPPPFVIDSPVVSPTPSTPATSFLAEWWQKDGNLSLDLYDNVPVIYFADNSPNVTLYAPPESSLGKLIGGDQVTFDALSVEDLIPTSHLHVSPVSL